MPRKERVFCTDPFEIHTRKVYKTVQKIQESLARTVNNPEIRKGTPVCLSCCKRLAKKPFTIPPAETTAPLEETLAAGPSTLHSAQYSSSSLSEVTSNQTSLNTSIEEDVIRTQAAETVGEALTALDQTPIRSSKCSI